MKSLKRHEGYLLIDHRNSPGVTPEFVRAAGLDVPAVGAGVTFEAATFKCPHCQDRVILNPNRTRDRHYCAKHDHYVCDKPTCVLECTPFEKIIEKFQNAVLLGEQRGE